MARLINESGVLGDEMTVTAQTVNTVSFDKIIEAIHRVQVEMGVSGISMEEATALVESGTMTQEEAWELLGTTAKEGATTLQGSTGSIKAAWSNLVTAFATPDADLSVYIDNFVNSAIVMGENMIPAFERALEGVGRFIEGMAKAISEKLPEIIEKDLPNFIQ